MGKHFVLFRFPLLALFFPGSCERAEGGVRTARGLRDFGASYLVSQVRRWGNERGEVGRGEMAAGKQDRLSLYITRVHESRASFLDRINVIAGSCQTRKP